MPAIYQQNKIGILGGGQLGRMLIQSGIDYNIDFSVLDPEPQAPCHLLSRFTCGKLTDYDEVIAFAKNCDILTIEIENVNTKALLELEKAGKKIYPQPHIIELIQDKRKQKVFYRDHQIPTADFILTTNREDVKKNTAMLPAVHKLGREGYDGRGVAILRTDLDIDKAFDSPGVLEKLIDFEKELAVIVARSANGEVRTFPAVEMVFHPTANLVEYLYAPAHIDSEIERKAQQLATEIIQKLDMIGLLAVELFLMKDGCLLVNEIAPRPHNSGHHTMEANVTSQYEQHLRAILNLPLGDTSTLKPGAMVNLLGEPGYEGLAKYQGLEEVMSLSGVHVHLYGKTITKPFRKMGHVTIVDSNNLRLIEKVKFVKHTLKVIA